MYDIKGTYRAESVDHALRLLAQNEGAALVNGGTDIMIRLKERRLTEATLISIRDVEEIKGISLRANGDIAIGAGTCFDDIYRDEIIRGAIPVLAQAANQVGSPQIRHVATIGGNLCNGAVSADSVPALLVLNAQLELAGPEGARQVPVTGFHAGPGQTVLRAGRELLAAIVIPRAEYEGYHARYIKFGQRNAMEIATLGAAVCLRLG
ncbi:MAG: FAD binding domain-containing protein, partial [Peptococcaceae bacterium]|nr:FAD binding domain-containing protein [Peptococcaceae bacterium]